MYSSDESAVSHLPFNLTNNLRLDYFRVAHLTMKLPERFGPPA